MAELLEVIAHQRACRRFSDRPVGDELVEQVLRAATFAPSAENSQPWAFVVVREQHRRAAIVELMRQAWEAGGRQHSAGRLDPRLLADVEEAVSGGLAGAPVLVVVCGDASRGLEVTLASSVYPATQNLLLAATGLGLGSAMTTLATASPRPLADLLGLPDHVKPMAVVPLGWPARPLGPPRRRPVRECAHRERYGAGW
ncbi:MAG TPA: nitroreductase family protein [Acidimicrobiales bacterium]|nr:nitroreductase family protein [Acidimicrobiales bacterium]